MTSNLSSSNDRNFIGYGRNAAALEWPQNCRVAINFCLNYEEGGEFSVPDGFPQTEGGLTESRASQFKGRDLAAESMFEYGSRSGIWRLVRIFEEFKLPATVIACGLAVERNQEFAKAIKELGYDICAHGWRWEYHSLLSIENERELISKTFSSLEANTGVKPSGWSCRYGPSLNTRNLLVEHGGFLYDSDSYSDDRPYWIEIAQKKHLVIPYSLVCNDANFLRGSLGTGQDFFVYLKDTFDMLYRESQERASMMSIGLHPRVIGQPGRALGLLRFIEMLSKYKDVWICRRADIANFWHESYNFI